MKSRVISVTIIATIVSGCTYFGEKIYEKASSPANLRLEIISENGGIIKYDWGALVEPDGDELAQNAMKDYCKHRQVNIISSDKRVIGEKKFEQTINFECAN